MMFYTIQPNSAIAKSPENPPEHRKNHGIIPRRPRSPNCATRSARRRCLPDYPEASAFSQWNPGRSAWCR